MIFFLLTEVQYVTNVGKFAKNDMAKEYQRRVTEYLEWKATETEDVDLKGLNASGNERGLLNVSAL